MAHPKVHMTRWPNNSETRIRIAHNKHHLRQVRRMCFISPLFDPTRIPNLAEPPPPTEGVDKPESSPGNPNRPKASPSPRPEGRVARERTPVSTEDTLRLHISGPDVVWPNSRNNC